MKLEEDNEVGAAKARLEARDITRSYATDNEIDSVRALDDRFSASMQQYFMNGLQDLEELLGNLSVQDVNWAETGIQYVRDVCSTLPQSVDDMIFNFRRSKGESLFRLSRYEEGDTCYAHVVQNHPNDAWAYIGWGDEYNPVYSRTKSLIYESFRTLKSPKPW